MLEPRLVRYQGSDPSLSYVYSGVTVVPQPFDATVLAVKQKVQELFPLAPDFNTCLLNYYRSGAINLRRRSGAPPPRTARPHFC